MRNSSHDSHHIQSHDMTRKIHKNALWRPPEPCEGQNNHSWKAHWSPQHSQVFLTLKSNHVYPSSISLPPEPFKYSGPQQPSLPTQTTPPLPLLVHVQSQCNIRSEMELGKQRTGFSSACCFDDTVCLSLFCLWNIVFQAFGHFTKPFSPYYNSTLV